MEEGDKEGNIMRERGMLVVGAWDWTEPGCWLTQETDSAPLLMKVNGRRFQEGPVLGRVRLSCNIN